jgi:hypothetical protein
VNLWQITMSFLWKLPRKSFGLFLIIIAFAVSITTLYVSSEHIFYWWDYAAYKEIAVDTSKMLVQYPLQALKAVYLSTWLDYNYYFALPLAPILKLFNYSRLGYIISLVLIYQIPMLIISGYITRKIFPSLSYAGWITIFTGLSIPVFWASTFRGYPDIGSVLLITIAVAIYLRDMELKQWQFQLPMIGILLGLTIIFRRHFAYNVASLLFSIEIFLLLFAFRYFKEGWKKFLLEFLNSLIKTQIILAFLVLTIVLLAPGLLMKVVYVNYLNLYASYSVDAFQVFILFLKTYGVLWIPTIIGLIMGIPKMQKTFHTESQNIDQRSLYFILLFGATSAIVWITIPRQIGTQYVLHVALPVVLGTSAFITWIASNSKEHYWLTTFGVYLILVFNLWAGLSPTRFSPIRTTLNYPPLYRQDYNEVIRLVDYLREITKGKEKVYIVDSSKLINSEIIHYAEVSKYGKDASLQILYSPQIDSRDFYPLEPLLQADYIVVTSPLQYHLSVNEQKVVKFVFDIFAQQWKLSKDFQELPQKFNLSGGAISTVYKRQSPSSLKTALTTFDQMQRYIVPMPGGQSDWIIITPPMPALTYSGYGKRFSAVLPSNDQPVTFLYVGDKSSQYHVTGKLRLSNEKCPPVKMSLRVFTLSDPMSVLYEERFVTSTGEFITGIEEADNNTALVFSFQQAIITSTLLCNPTIEWELTK